MGKQGREGVKWGLFLSLAVLRVLNSLSIRTFFQPDEYWQSLEPGHIGVFGYGFKTWEWREGLRSAAHPKLYEAVYVASEWLGVDVVMGPKVFQGVVAAVGDYQLFRLGQRILGGEGAWYALIASLGSAFNWFCMTRTFSNSLEMVLTTVALAYWPWNSNLVNLRHLTVALSVASVSCIFRPTNGLIWMFLGTNLVARANCRAKIILLTVVIGIVSLSVNFLVDYSYYGEPTFPLIKFLEFNVVQSLSEFYGVSPSHYYLSQGIPILMISYLPLVLWEMWQSRRSVVVWLVLFTIGTYSLLAHKEVRFIYPLMPLLHLLLARSILRFKIPNRKRVMAWLVAINVPVAFYFTQYHQRGVVDVMQYLRQDPSVSSVGFLMPCHSTPWQAHLHRDIPAWFLTCEPPIGFTPEAKRSYLDIADQFYDNPIGFLDQHMGVDYQWPSHLAFFEALEDTIKPYLQEHTSYELDTRFFNSHFHDDHRRKGDVLVYKWK
ncbi:hypothetical protein TRICI_001944 [Trichomonascus ciferrii]|uniref:Mannosyltransferase n=1 Tax=Trichomonascus ciferrii TaxID=44093 RepID=A0A642V763_9ASCO|nr:hypothetical protein TRICI_001944 [Trichomonascus ciferrii]